MKQHLIRAATILIASLAIAFGLNAARKDGIPVIRPS